MLSSIGPLQLLIVLAIVLIVFGSKRLRTIGSDIGASLRDFRHTLSRAEDDTNDNQR